MTTTEITVANKAKLFRGLGDGSRLAILEALCEGSRSVTEIVEATALTQPNVSNHLACLLDCGLVRREQRGRFVYYDLSDARIEQLLALAAGVLADVAGGLDACRRYDGSSS
jgi:DNA-binding transcriptional ArsR family regulator